MAIARQLNDDCLIYMGGGYNDGSRPGWPGQDGVAAGP